jgi:hypothetical protein
MTASSLASRLKAKEDRIAWLAYPKAGKLDTDLNRDILWRHMLG